MIRPATADPWSGKAAHGLRSQWRPTDSDGRATGLARRPRYGASAYVTAGSPVEVIERGRNGGNQRALTGPEVCRNGRIRHGTPGTVGPWG